jgi:hypothetical protein
MIISYAAVTRADENEDTLKCIVQYLKTKNVHEDFFDSVNTRFDNQINCEYMIQGRLDRAYAKIEDKLNADKDFARYTTCVMREIKTEENKKIVLQREAIKINGLGIQIWNYFSQKERLDQLKKITEDSINTAIRQKCSHIR